MFTANAGTYSQTIIQRYLIIKFSSFERVINTIFRRWHFIFVFFCNFSKLTDERLFAT